MDGFHFSTGICDRFARRLTLTAPRFQLRPQRFRVCDKAALPLSLKVRYDEDSKKPPSLPTSVIKQPGKQMAISLFTLSFISSPRQTVDLLGRLPGSLPGDIPSRWTVERMERPAVERASYYSGLVGSPTVDEHDLPREATSERMPCDTPGSEQSPGLPNCAARAPWFVTQQERNRMDIYSIATPLQESRANGNTLEAPDSPARFAGCENAPSARNASLRPIINLDFSSPQNCKKLKNKQIH